MNTQNPGKQIRLSRILQPHDQRAVVVAFDHGVHLGAIPGTYHPGDMLESLTAAGVDAFLVSPGIARAYHSIFCGRGAPGLILRLDWTNLWRDKDHLGSDEGRGTLIAQIEDAVRLGADAVLVYMFIGYEDPLSEARQVGEVARLAQDCEAAGMGCIIEPMARGKRVGEHIYNAEYIALGARMACEIGADVLKTDYSGSVESFEHVVESSFRPILIAGGPKTNSHREALEMVDGALSAGANGMFFGRNIFQADDPARIMQAMVGLIHQNLSVSVAENLLTEAP